MRKPVSEEKTSVYIRICTFFRQIITILTLVLTVFYLALSVFLFATGFELEALMSIASAGIVILIFNKC